jgi:hypothetical protein
LIPKKFKEAIEQLTCMSEKRLASSYSLLVLGDYFESVKKRKSDSYNLVLKHLNKFHTHLKQILITFKKKFKRYCFEELLNEKLNNRRDDNELNKMQVFSLNKICIS